MKINYAKIKAACIKWQELFWIAAAAALVWLAWEKLRELDVTAGVELSALWGYALTSAGFVLACFGAWLAQQAYGLEYDDDTERTLVEAIIARPAWPLVLTLALPWLMWFAVAALLMRALGLL